MRTGCISTNKEAAKRETATFWDVCQQHGIAAINALPYGSGILARGPSTYPRYMYGQASDAYLQRAFFLEALCQRYQVPLAAVALQFSMRDPRIASTIVGISKPERLQETVRLAQLVLPEDIWEEIKERTSDACTQP